MKIFVLLKNCTVSKYIHCYLKCLSCLNIKIRSYPYWYNSYFLLCFCYRNQNVFQIQSRLFFPHSLMYIPFLDLNEIIHPNCEEIPDHVCHFASAMYCNNDFWCNDIKIRSEMEMEGHRDNYIQTYISYLNSLRANYNLYSKGLLFL